MSTKNFFLAAQMQFDENAMFFDDENHDHKFVTTRDLNVATDELKPFLEETFDFGRPSGSVQHVHIFYQLANFIHSFVTRLCRHFFFITNNYHHHHHSSFWKALDQAIPYPSCHVLSKSSCLHVSPCRLHISAGQHPNLFKMPQPFQSAMLPSQQPH